MDSPRLRVLYLNHAAKPSGAEFALWRMLGAIDRRQVQPIVLFGEEGSAAGFMREIGVETHVLPMPENVREVRKDTLGPRAFMHVERLRSIAAYAARVAQFARRSCVQIIHTNTIKAHLYGAVAGRLARLPVVWHLRDYVNESYLPSAAVKVVRLMARYAPKHVIGVSRSVIEQVRLGDGGRRSSVVLDGLSDRELEAEREDRPWPAAPARIGIVGRLASWKGQHIFIEAASKVIAAGFDAEFVIVGSPLFGEAAYEAELHRRAGDLGISARVKFHGFTRDVPSELRKLDILVHASTSGEPFGQVIVEGMAIGLPVIASRGGGVPEIVAHGENGLLTTMGDADDLGAAMISLLNNPELARRLGRSGYEHVRKHFRSSQGARKVEEIYRSISAAN